MYYVLRPSYKRRKLSNEMIDNNNNNKKSKHIITFL